MGNHRISSKGFTASSCKWLHPIKTWKLIYFTSCISFALLTFLAIVINGADCLTSNQSNYSFAERVSVVKSTPPLNGQSGGYKRTKNAFREVFENLTIYVKENTPIGSKLTDIQADDQGPHNAQITYGIVDGPDHDSFILRKDNLVNKVELANGINFDYESPKKLYHIVIRATSIYFFYEVHVDIQVTDENDNKPILDDFTIVFNNYKNHFPYGPIGRVPAFDADVNDQLRYRVMAGNNAQLVVVNETNGDIQLNPWLNSNVPLKAVIAVAVSDGSNEAFAQMVLKVNLVTDIMLQNSVVLRLDGIGREDFLNGKYEIFLDSMASILYVGDKYSTKDIILFDIEESLQDSQPVESFLTYRPYYSSSNFSNSTIGVNISFSARADGNDVESYLPSQFIEDKIHINRASLSKRLEVIVAPFQDNPCLNEPCPAYQECQAIHKFEKASKNFITTKNMIFRSIRASQSHICNCPQTFTGMKHKSECNLQINQCLSNPCQNGGICHMHESGFTCECKAGFLGFTCEHSFSNSTCQSISNHTRSEDFNQYERQSTMCSGKSRCVNTNKSYFSTAKTGQLSIPSYGFSCQSCPHPQWSTELCQLRARSFGKNSYITLPGLRRHHRFHISLKFATFQNDALLIYNGRYNDKHDFIALEIVDSILKFSYSLMSTTYVVTLPSISVSNGDWHSITIDYKDRNVTLLIDDCDPVIDEALARTQGVTSRRCSNSSYVDPNSMERNLDLTGPMQLGSLLPIPVEFPVNAPQFVGCMSDLYIDHQLVDLYNSIQDVGTQPGCPEKRNFCQQHSCNGHPCQASWGTAKCSCGDDYLGKSCEILISNEKVRRFNGNSYLSFSPIESTIPQSWQISLHFRTINPNGVLMRISLEPESNIFLELFNGGLRLSYRSQNITFNKILLDDGEWHYVELTWSTDYTHLQVDYNPNLSISSSELGNIAGLIAKMVTIGAAQTIKSSDVSMESPDFTSSIANLQSSEFPSLYTYGNNSQSFVGCIYGVNVSDNSEQWLTNAEERNVERGCPIADICESVTCPANSRCVKKGMNQHKCVCNPGFIGDRCIPICELNPCQGEGSKCISVNRIDTSIPSESTIDTPAEYQCECEPFRAGKNCEQILHQKCPSNWWGKPVPGTNSSICGRCNCDESKGLDGDCDKVTGQCLCKLYHYQPPGSDYCLPCDCYDDGSKVSLCDQKTGQCKCRPGVVGRRCDTCAGPYAEVTLRGCEVVYDACPKAFSDGVWWDKTPLDKLATQQCPPSTSTGTATRFCHKSEGWEKSNMFDCISNTFIDLYLQYQTFEENKFPMTTGLAIKVASNLRQALNETINNPSLRLYGSDMYISFRLIHHLIQHESKQSGLNLTHRQDIMYIRNIVESISYILDPAYAENWPEIAARPPKVGPEYLLKLLDSFGRILIESQSDTFTQPFEISTKYLTFGLDIISSDPTWESGRSSMSGLNPPPYATDPIVPSAPQVDFNANSNELENQYLNDVSSSASFFERSQKDSQALIVPKHKSGGSDSSDDTVTKAVIPYKIIRIKTNTDLSSSTYYQAKSRAKRDEIVLPDFKFLRPQPALVVYSIYRSLGNLLPNNHDNTVQDRLGLVAMPNSPVIWLTVRPANSSEFVSKTPQPKVNYILKIRETSGKTRPQCAIWDFVPQPLSNKNQTSYGLKQTGRFTTKGCEIKGIHSNHKIRSKYDYVNCSCDHLGAVTVLMDDVNYDFLVGEESTIGDTALIVSISVSLLILTIIYFIITFVRGHAVKSNSNSINKNLVFILIMIELLILYTVLSRGYLSQREYQCKLVAIFLHYFSISLFFWLFVNAVHFYRMLTELRDINHGSMKFYRILGYAVPAFFVTIAVGLRIEQFGNHLFCWLSTHEPIIWSMFGPIALISCPTAILFLMALCKSMPDKEDPSGAELLKNHMIINIIKTPLIAIYWLATVYAMNDAFYLEWSNSFPILTLTKSIGLLFLLCVFDKHIRYNLYATWLRFRGENIPFMDDQIYGNQGKWPNLVDEVDKSFTYGGYNGQVMTPGFQNSTADMFEPEILAFSAASTTSRSTTETSSSAYQPRRVKSPTNYEKTGRSRHRRRNKKSHKHHSHKHHHHRDRHHHHHHHHHRSHRHHEGDYDQYESRHYDDQQITNDSQNYLASSHSSDEDDASVVPKNNYGSKIIQDVETNKENSQSDKLGEESKATIADDRQTVPMELASASTSSAQQQQQQQHKHEDESANMN